VLYSILTVFYFEGIVHIMHISRIAKETARLTETASPTSRSTRLQARRFAQSLSTYVANGVSATKSEEEEEMIKEAVDSGDNSSELSSAGSTSSVDIETLPMSLTGARKRKRGTDPAPMTVVSVTTTSCRQTQRKTNLESNVQDENKPRNAKSQPARKAVKQDGQVEIHPPPQWEETYAAVKEMRKKILAPVDTMGCETLAEAHASPRVRPPTTPSLSQTYVLTPYPPQQDQRFQTLIALMLSSQTKDTVTAAAMRRLQTALPPPGLTLASILAVAPDTLNELIWAVGFHNTKTRHIKAAALVLRDHWAGDIPDTAEGLMALPGVGPKMAYLCLSAAWGRTEGIGVDVHVHRITNLWGWHETRAPEETRARLQAWLPRDRWHEINHLLVGFGQTVCLPVGRRCGECALSGTGLCPSAVVGRKTVTRKRAVKLEGSVDGDGVEVKIEEDSRETVESVGQGRSPTSNVSKSSSSRSS